jgi:hypothetical protein
MFGERLQILVSRDQRRRLEGEARRRSMSVGAFIREAIDARLGGATTAERLRAVGEIRSMSGGRFLTPEILDRIVEEERERGLPTSRRRR